MADGDLIQFDGGVLVADMVQSATTTDASELTQYPIEDGSFIADHMIRQPRTLSLTLVQTQTPIEAIAGFARVLQTLGYEERPLGSQTVKTAYGQRPEGQRTTRAPVRQSEFRPAGLFALPGAALSLLFGGADKEISFAGLDTGQPPGSKDLSFTGLDTGQPLAGKSLSVHVLAAGAPVERVNEFHANLLSLLVSATPVIVQFKGASYIDLVLVSVARTDAAGQAGRASFEVQLKQIATVETKTVKLPPVPAAKAPKQVAAPAQETNADQHQRAKSWALDIGIGLGQSEPPP